MKEFNNIEALFEEIQYLRKSHELLFSIWVNVGAYELRDILEREHREDVARDLDRHFGFDDSE